MSLLTTIFIFFSTWLLLLLAQVIYNQVQPLWINYLASSHRGNKYMHRSIDSVQCKACITSWVTVWSYTLYIT